MKNMLVFIKKINQFASKTFYDKPYLMMWLVFVGSAFLSCKNPIEQTSEQAVYDAQLPEKSDEKLFYSKPDTIAKNPSEMLTETKDSIVSTAANTLAEIDEAIKQRMAEREAYVKKHGLETPPSIGPDSVSVATDTIKPLPKSPADPTKCACENKMTVKPRTTLSSIANVNGTTVAILKAINKNGVFVGNDKKKGNLKVGAVICLKRKKC